MKVHEYQAKEIFSTYGIPVERHALCHTQMGLWLLITEWG